MTQLEKSILKKYGLYEKKPGKLTLMKANVNPGGGAPAPKQQPQQGGGGSGKRGANVGEVRNWKSGPHMKTDHGWIPVKKGKGGGMVPDTERIAKEGMKHDDGGSTHPELQKKKGDVGKGEYSVHTDKGHKKAPGKRVDIEGHHTFAYKQGGKIKVAHAETGKVIGHGDDLDEAKEMAGAWLNSPKAEKRIAAHKEEHGEAPGFKMGDSEKQATQRAEKAEGQVKELTIQVKEMASQMKEMTAMMKEIKEMKGGGKTEAGGGGSSLAAEPGITQGQWEKGEKGNEGRVHLEPQKTKYGSYVVTHMPDSDVDNWDGYEVFTRGDAKKLKEHLLEHGDDEGFKESRSSAKKREKWINKEKSGQKEGKSDIFGEMKAGMGQGEKIGSAISKPTVTGVAHAAMDVAEGATTKGKKGNTVHAPKKVTVNEGEDGKTDYHEVKTVDSKGKENTMQFTEESEAKEAHAHAVEHGSFKGFSDKKTEAKIQEGIKKHKEKKAGGELKKPPESGKKEEKPEKGFEGLGDSGKEISMGGEDYTIGHVKNSNELDHALDFINEHKDGMGEDAGNKVYGELHKIFNNIDSNKFDADVDSGHLSKVSDPASDIENELHNIAEKSDHQGFKGVMDKIKKMRDGNFQGNLADHLPERKLEKSELDLEDPIELLESMSEDEFLNEILSMSKEVA